MTTPTLPTPVPPAAAPAPAAPVKRTMAVIKAEEKAKAAAALVEAEPSATHEDEAAPEGHVWLAYLGHQPTYTSRRSSTPIVFRPRPWSKDHPVALVPEAFAGVLVELGVLRTKEDGKSREPEDFSDAFAPFDEVKHRRPAKRRGAGV